MKDFSTSYRRKLVCTDQKTADWNEKKLSCWYEKATKKLDYPRMKACNRETPRAIRAIHPINVMAG